MDTILCPHCGKVVEITQAFKKQALGEELAKLGKQHEEEIEKVQKEAQVQSEKKAEEEFALKLKRLSQDNEDSAQRNQRLTVQIEELLKENRQSKREKEDLKIDMQKKLAEEEEKIRTDASKKAEEAQHLKIAEKDKQLESALRELEDMKRKLQQGSQQTQGEAFELELQGMLTREFPNDKILEVAKGTRGGDIVQEIWDRNGNFCGKLLWELKNTKAWSELWIDKLKSDQRETKAEFAVIVSEAVPEGIESAKYYKGVWISKRNFAIGLAYSLRVNIIQVAMAKKASEGKKEKADILYSYFTGTEFRLRVEAIVEAFTNMQLETEKEKRYFNTKWARDEKNLRQVIDNTYGMHGDLKGIVGQTLPQIKGLDTLELSGEEET